MKCKREWCAVIEQGRICNVVAGVFVQKSIVALDANFPLMTPAIEGEACVEVAITEGIVLEHLDGSRFGVGVEVVGVVADHAVQVAYGIRGEEVLVGDNPDRLDIVGALGLACGLLDEFVGNIVSGDLMAHVHGELVVGCDFAAIVHGEVSEGPGVRVVLRHDGIEVMVRAAAVAARS